MARPIKQGLDYFPFDVDFFQDEKIVAVAGEFGIKGEITVVKLLCAVYRNGYFLEWSEMLKYKLLKELPGVSVELLEQIINRLVKWEFFDKKMFDSASILTSKAIQRRYHAISNKMHRKIIITNYCLLDLPSPTSRPSPGANPGKKKKTEQKESQTLIPAPEVSQSSRPIENTIPAILSDSVWRQTVCKRYSISPEELPKEIEEFRQHCIRIGRSEHKDLSDVKRHFCSWINTAKSRSKSEKTRDSALESDYSFKGGFGGQDV